MRAFSRIAARRWGRGVAGAIAVLAVLESPVLARSPSVAQFIKMRWPTSADLSPDGSLYYLYNPDGLVQLHVRRGGATAATKLTDFPDGISGYRLSRDGRWIAVLAGVGGNEQTDIYLMDTTTGRMRALFCHPDVVYERVVWRRDSKAFAMRANDISRSDFYIYVYDLASNTTKNVLAEKGSFSPVDFTADGRRLMVLKETSITYTQLFEIDLAAGTHREVTPPGEQWAFEPIGYLKDDKRFLAASNYKRDKMAFVLIDTASGALTHPLPDLDAHEADGGELNEDRTLAALSQNEDGYRTLRLFELPEFKPLEGPTTGRGIVGNVRFRGDVLLYSMESSNTPGIVYKWPLGTTPRTNPPTGGDDRSPMAITEADTQGIDVSAFRLPELIRYKSFDGMAIPAFLYLPADYARGEKIPFVVEYHGGPEAQYRPGFRPLTQYLLTQGYGVLAPNVRGSSGYGTKYLEMDNYKNRMASVKDGVAAARWLVEQGYSTPDKIAAYGGSYGGFMVMACITEAPEMFGAACNVVGICNMQTFLERTKDYRRKLREVEYGLLSDAEFLRSISPIHKVEKVRAPLLIVHGANDPRVPLYEAEQLYEKMKKLGRPVEMLVFPDEGHGFRKEANRIRFGEALTGFFDRYLKRSEQMQASG